MHRLVCKRNESVTNGLPICIDNIFSRFFSKVASKNNKACVEADYEIMYTLIRFFVKSFCSVTLRIASKGKISGAKRVFASIAEKDLE